MYDDHLAAHRLLHQKEEDFVEQIDVHDLPEEEVQLIAAFVEFLRFRRQEHLQPTRLCQLSRNLSLLHGPSG